MHILIIIKHITSKTEYYLIIDFNKKLNKYS